MQNTQLDHRAHQSTPAKHALCLLAHNVQRPANIGSLFRLADALGMEKIHLTGRSCTPAHPKARKAARTTEQRVPFEQADDPLPLVAALKRAGYRIVSLEISSGSIDLDRLPVAPGDRICLVLGNESAGVCQALLDASDATVHIPMHGANSSMNVASACAIAAYVITGKLA
ncbi:TrmH family RNA methyltransferase [Rhodanobacter sp. PCA2]|uniref:TrmH family RNA methyltransferase n=1 Tax=Rhodanobacter sp. PCA2 TaxID=2006117 RepID=UPI0015E6F5B6|nr:TrmH family RNA methyltransferase [Rhodanobacter sp. PCA2]MBA2077722.1 RNA methyltransferase [Rhodanobacter sp. PCA2]